VGRTRRSSPFWALWGSNRLTLESGVIHASRVIHLAMQGRELELGPSSPRRGAVCAAAHRRRAACRGHGWTTAPRCSAKGRAELRRGSPRCSAAGRQGEIDGDADRRRSGGSARGRGSAAVLRAPGLCGSARGDLAGVHTGIRETRGSPTVRNRSEPSSPAAASSRQFRGVKRPGSTAVAREGAWVRGEAPAEECRGQGTARRRFLGGAMWSEGETAP